jgi:hypothetical protein
MAFSLILSPPALFGCRFPYLFGSTISRLTYMPEGQVMSSSTTIEDLHQQLDRWRRSLGLRCVSSTSKIWSNCLLECLIAIEHLLSLSFLGQHLILEYPKSFDAYYLISFHLHHSFQHFLLVYKILAFEYKLLSPSFPESQDEIPFKGGSLSHPKNLISECEPFFPQET